MEQTKEVGFADKFKAAVALTDQVKAIKVTNRQEHAIADERVKAIRELEKELEIEYKAHPVIVEAKRLQAIKSDLASILEMARKATKSKQMAWEDEQERLRQAEERRLAAGAKKQADADAAKLLAEKAKELKKAIKAGDEAAAEHIKSEAADIKSAAAITPVVVLEKTTPTVARRMIPKFRVVNESLVPIQYRSIDEVKIGGVIRSLKANHGIPGVEYYEVPA